MFGYCYTQLTDVFQEKNGLFAFDRSAKFDLARIRAIQSALAAIEDAPSARNRPRLPPIPAHTRNPAEIPAPRSGGIFRIAAQRWSDP